MPTVRAGVEPVAVFPVPKGKGSAERISIFPAQHWEKWGGGPGRWRVMVGEQWYTRRGERVSFFTQDELEQFGGAWFLRALNLKSGRPRLSPLPPHPALRDRCRCRWKPAGTEHIPNAWQTFAKSDPILAANGKWMILLAGGLGWKPCTEVTPLDHFGKSISLPPVDGEPKP